MNVLVVAAHPDDEVLGCGGTIAAHAAQGDHVEVVILAEGVTSRQVECDRATNTLEIEQLAQSAQQAAAILGVRNVHLHDFPDNRMDSVPLLEVVKVVEDHVGRLRPTIVYTHFVGDVNIDHRVAYQACVTACRPQPGMTVRSLLCFEVPSSTEWQPPVLGQGFQPNWFSDISATLGAKLDALAAYRQEMRPWPHPRSINAAEHLARWRGSSVGVDAAEAFVVARHLGFTAAKN